jgi:hypothetical protein
MMTQYGEYIYADSYGNYWSFAQGTAVPDDYYQVCMSPEDLALAQADPNTHAPIISDGYLITTEYNPVYEYLPWGVGPGECVVVGGDGAITVEGTTHIYNTTWSGIFLGLEIEKRMTYVDRLRFYFQVSMPDYSSEGTWPNRTDWQQNPSFLDEGSSGAFHYQAEMEYSYQFSERVQLALKVDTSYFHIGKISGEIYFAGYQDYQRNEDGEILFDESTGAPILLTYDPHTEKTSDALKYAEWQSFGLHLGIKYAF